MPPVSFTLPATASYAWRMLVWNRVTPDGMPSTGVATLLEAKKVGNKQKVRKYALQETVRTAKTKWKERYFKFSKPLATKKGNDDDGPYHVCIREKMHHECECKAYLKSGKCCHIETVLKLIAEGQLPAPTGTPGTPQTAPV